MPLDFSHPYEVLDRPEGQTPQFDPRQPFESVSDSFDPSKPFDVVPDSNIPSSDALDAQAQKNVAEDEMNRRMNAGNADFSLALTHQLPADVGSGLHKAGQGLYNALGAYAFEGIGEPELQMQQLAGETNEKGQTPIEEGAADLPVVGRALAAGTKGIIQTAPQMAGVVGAQALGIPAPISAGAIFGATPQGFDPEQAIIGALAPEIGKLSGPIVEGLASKLGVHPEVAEQVWAKIGGPTGATALIGADQAAHIMQLPPDQRKEAIIDAVGNVASMAGLGFLHGEEKPEVTPQQDEAARQNLSIRDKPAQAESHERPIATLNDAIGQKLDELKQLIQQRTGEPNANAQTNEQTPNVPSYSQRNVPQGTQPIREIPPTEEADTAANEPADAEAEPLNPGGAQEDLPPEQRAISEQNNSHAAFEALAKEKGGTPLPEEEAPSESAETGGEEGSQYGIAERVREERAKAGQVAPVESGEGISAPDSVEHGRDLLTSGADPEKALSDFEKTKRANADDVAHVRAQGEKLAKAAADAEKAGGVKSPEYKKAFDDLSAWDKRTKAMQTEWHKQGMAQQGATDLDTGTFTGLQREHKAQTGKEFNPRQADRAKRIAESNTKADAGVEASKKALYDAIPTEQPAFHPKVLDAARKIVDRWNKEADASHKALREIMGRTNIGVDPTALYHMARIGRAFLAEKALDFADWSAKMVEKLGESKFTTPEVLKQVYEKSNKMLDGDDTIPRVVRKAIRESREVVDDVDKRALAAANKTVRENAVRMAEAEKKANIAKTVDEMSAAKVEKEQAQKSLDIAKKSAKDAAARAAKSERESSPSDFKQEQRKADEKAANAAQKAVDKTTRDAAVKAAKEEQKKSATVNRPPAGTIEGVRYELKYHKEGQAFDQREIASLWAYAKAAYLDKGVDSFDDIRHKLATDLGMKVSEVTKGLTQNQSLKRLADDVWKKQRDARRLKQDAKMWIEAQKTPMLLKIPQAIRQEAFNAKVMGHLSVGLGTHAPMLAFQPHYWTSFFKNYGRMWKYGLNEAGHEAAMQDLQRRPNWTVARRAGLENDPFSHEEYNIKGLVERVFPNLTHSGNRAYDALKMLRQDMFDQQWDKLPQSMQKPEMAMAIADSVNHVTGIVKRSPFPKAVNSALFAPRLLASRYAWAFGDPAKALGIAAQWKQATPAQKYFATQQAREKATVIATMGAMLVANQALLSASGSDQKVNFDDPTRSDWLKFKGAGVNVSFGNAMLTTLRLPIREAAILRENTTLATGKKRFEGADRGTYDALGQYFRNQLNPAMGDTADILFQNDPTGRPLPLSRQKVPAYLQREGVTKPYTWGEWVRDAAMPIPLEESVKQVFNEYGMPKSEAEKWTKIIGTAIYMGGTGGRVEEDRNLTDKKK